MDLFLEGFQPPTPIFGDYSYWHPQISILGVCVCGGGVGVCEEERKGCRNDYIKPFPALSFGEFFFKKNLIGGGCNNKPHGWPVVRTKRR